MSESEMPETVATFVSPTPDVAGALDIVVRFGAIEGDHHKAWMLDQIARCLTGENYGRLVEWACESDDPEDELEWDEGVAP